MLHEHCSYFRRPCGILQVTPWSMRMDGNPPRGLIGSTPHARTILNPAAKCPVCRARVAFYRSERGGYAYFDAIGRPWSKHRCVPLGSVKSSQQATARCETNLRLLFASQAERIKALEQKTVGQLRNGQYAPTAKILRESGVLACDGQGKRESATRGPMSKADFVALCKAVVKACATREARGQEQQFALRVAEGVVRGMLLRPLK